MATSVFSLMDVHAKLPKIVVTWMGGPCRGLRWNRVILLTIVWQEIAQEGSLLRTAHRTVCPVKPGRLRTLYLRSRICLGICLAATLSVPCGAAMEVPNAGLPRHGDAVQQARVDPHTINLPITDGKDVRFTRLSVAQGLSQTRVAQIAQDDQGFLWFGTQDGLNRYDGYNFKVFKNDPGRPNSLSGIFVYALFKDRSGAIWVGTDQYLDRFDRATEKFTHHRLDTENPIVIHISEDHAGMLWLATSKGLYRLDPGTGSIKRFGHDPNDRFSLSSNDVKSSGEDRAGTFWVANSEGLDAFDRATGRVTMHVPLHESVREFSFHEDRSGVFWIIYGSGNGLAVFDRATKTLTRYSFYEQDRTETALTGVYAILEDRDGTIWFGTMGAGLLKFDRARQSVIRYQTHPGDLESLAENRVISLFEDREGNIWTGLHAMAPNFFARRPPPFEKFQPGSSTPNSLGENLVNAIYEDRQGNLWMGASGALNRVDRRTGQYTFYRPEGPAVSTEVLAILEDRSGTLWVGTLGHGLNSFDRRTGRFNTYLHDPIDPASLSHNIVTRLFMDRAGSMWATSWNGLNRFDPATQRFTVYKRDPQSTTESYFSIDEDSQGYLWLGSTAGLVRFEPSTRQFTVFKHNPDDPKTLSNNTVNSVYVDRSGAVWLGTQNGLNRLEPKTATFTVFHEKDGLPGNAVSCILEDGHGELWMSTNNGISRFDPLKRTFRNYSTADGLPGGDLTAWGACFRSPSGEMFFGGFAGATAFHPEKVLDNTYIPPIVLTDFRLSGATVEPGSSSPLKRSITYAEDLTLSHEQNVFSVQFSALSFLSPHTNRYRYKLEGLDSSWHEVGSEQRVASYTTLPAGVYEFRVQGATSRGPWSEPGTALRIEILPPWWNTWWFRTTIGALFVLLLLAVYYYRLRQMAQQLEMRLEERVGERTRIARELHDSLLQGFQGLMFRLQAVRDLLPARPSEAVQVLDAALDRGDRAIVEARAAVQDLRSNTVVTNDLAQAVAALGEELSRLKGSEAAPSFRVLEEGKSHALDPILRDEIYRIAREALRNAFQHASARKIEAEISYGESRFSLRIRDDGLGIDALVLDRGSLTGHWGLPGMRERAKRFGGALNVQSRSGAGTEIELTIPAVAAYSTSGARFWFSRNRRESTHAHDA